MSDRKTTAEQVEKALETLYSRDAVNDTLTYYEGRASLRRLTAELSTAQTLLREVLDLLSYPGFVAGAAEGSRQRLISRLVDALKGSAEELPHRRGLLRVEKLFESGLRLPEGTPIWVQETGPGAIGHFYPDPYKLTSHAFALGDDEYTVLVRAKL